ncbi:MAG: hypothetical protein HY810_10645, partial [Candidatus Omnitrophica bacterium]|nr:hypothetical protein [Candidatus Omnitrophota bacterium]
FFSSHIMALLTTMFLYIASEFMPTAVKLTAVSGAWGQKLVTGFLYALLPNMDKLDIKASAVYGQLPSMGYLSMATLYAFIYIVFLWLINLFIFQNKEY